MSHVTVRRLLVTLVVALGSLSIAGCGGSNQLVPSTSAPRSETTQLGHFVVSYAPKTKIALNQPQTWVVHVETPNGTSVNDATLKVAGGMPDMGHALPTDPLISKKLGSGDYRVEGLLFNMPGAWVVTVDVRAGGMTDQASFKLFLQ